MKKTAFLFVLVSFLGVNGFAQNVKSPDLKTLDGAVMQARRVNAAERLSAALDEEIAACARSLTALKRPVKQEIVNALAGLVNAYNELRRADVAAARGKAAQANAVIETGWGECLTPLHLLKHYFPYEAYQRSTSYEEFEEFERNLRTDLQVAGVAVNYAFPRPVTDAYKDFSVYMAGQKSLNVSHALQALVNLVDEYEDLYAKDPEQAKLVARYLIDKPVQTGWGRPLSIKLFVRDHACEVFGDTGAKYKQFASHL